MKISTLTELVVKTLADNKAQDIVELDVTKLTSSFDKLVICTGTSTRHTSSLAKKVIDAVKQSGVKPYGMEGERQGEWVLIDLCDIVVHVMLQEQRELYHLEKLWMITESIKKQKAPAKKSAKKPAKKTSKP